MRLFSFLLSFFSALFRFQHNVCMRYDTSMSTMNSMFPCQLTLQNLSRFTLLLLVLTIIAAVLAIQLAGPMAGVFHRDLGTGTAFMPQWVILCDGYNPKHYAPRSCTMLIDCVYTAMTQVQVADTAIGGTLAGLVPTILTLLGMLPSVGILNSSPSDISNSLLPVRSCQHLHPKS